MKKQAASPAPTRRVDLDLLPGPDRNLSVAEVKLLWSFLHGDIMVGGIRQQIRNHWGLCPRHAWGHAVVEIELWQAGAGERGGHQPFDVGILYEDLLETMIRKLTDSRPRSRVWLLTPRGSCPICRDLHGYVMAGFGGGYAGSNGDALTVEANGMIHIRTWVAETCSLWRVCPRCAGLPPGDEHETAPLCRRHILERGSLNDQDTQQLVSHLTETRRRLLPLIDSMTQAGRPSTPTENASWFQALGWFDGWGFPRSLVPRDLSPTGIAVAERVLPRPATSFNGIELGPALPAVKVLTMSDETESSDNPTSSEQEPAQEPDARWLTPGVGSVAAASFFSDSGHEIATAILPSFLTSVLHGSAASLGLIEGVSDALTGVAKLIGGPLANDPARRRTMATGGYLATALATAAIGLATTVGQVGALRGIAWAARGFRSPARDALLSSLAPRRAYGRAFGLERAGDNLGAVVGPLLAAGLVAWLGIRPALWFALIPGVFAAVAITVAAREAKRLHAVGPRERIRLDFVGLRAAGLVRPLLPIILFECGNIATTMLILRATELLQVAGRGVSAAAALAILIYAAHNAVGAAVAYFGGRWIDHSGPRIVFTVGACLYVFAYLGFAIGVQDWWFLLIAFSLAGAGIGLAETAESALVAHMLPDRLRGSGFGVIGAVQTGGNLIGTVVVGVLYTAVSPTAGFLYAASWMALSVISAAALRAAGRQ